MYNYTEIIYGIEIKFKDIRIINENLVDYLSDYDIFYSTYNGGDNPDSFIIGYCVTTTDFNYNLVEEILYFDKNKNEYLSNVEDDFNRIYKQLDSSKTTYKEDLKEYGLSETDIISFKNLIMSKQPNLRYVYVLATS